MFHKDESTQAFTDIGKDATKNVETRLPGGIYRFSRDPWDHVMFIPQESDTDRYIPVPDPQMEAVRAEFDEYFDPAMRAHMAAQGLVNKRGILLWGPPGTGKTRLMLHIMETAGRERDAITINGIDPDSDLIQAVEAIRRDDPARDIIILYDEFQKTAKRYLDNLLRVLDGTDSMGNLMIVGSTNHIDKVPDKLFSRPSRFGLVAHIGPIAHEPRVAFLLGLFPAMGAATADVLARLTAGQSLDSTKEVALLHVIRGYTADQIAARLTKTRDDLKAAGVTFGLLAPDGTETPVSAENGELTTEAVQDRVDALLNEAATLMNMSPAKEGSMEPSTGIAAEPAPVPY